MLLPIAAAAACYSGGALDGATNGLGGGGGGGGGGGSTVDTGLPCDVQAVLASQCDSCHSNPPTASAPMPLVTYADLTAASAVDPTQTYAQRAVTRMQQGTMPKGGTPAAADIKTLSDWIAAGYPKGNCGGTSAVACTSNTYWPAGSTRGRGLMNPGLACIACHMQQEGEPKMAGGGTVYPTAHEKDLCYGAPLTTGQVIVTDANGATYSAPINANGNFMIIPDGMPSDLAYPITAKVVVGTAERAMTTPANTADCNTCHTEQGANGAPGRILAP